ncbi:MAG TPA: hypothetical protein VNQ80_05475 [Parapedobacter sp.]|nr:hypothetical protein [Parapedobacter sp.]
MEAPDGTPFPTHPVVGIALYDNQPVAVDPVYEPHMGNAFQRGVVDAEHVALSDRPGVVTLRPDRTAGREERRAPGIAGLGVSRFAKTPAYVGRAPCVAGPEAAVVEVLLDPGAVVAARGFPHAQFGHVGVSQPLACIGWGRGYSRAISTSTKPQNNEQNKPSSISRCCHGFIRFEGLTIESVAWRTSATVSTRASKPAASTAAAAKANALSKPGSNGAAVASTWRSKGPLKANASSATSNADTFRAMRPPLQ